jgi:8-oxo-dGTP pyrophosphatase MutT (NUDIX family)
MGASILPVTEHDGKILFLFGKERDIDENPGWSDFGGGTDKGETFIQTAAREGSEELTGFLGDRNAVMKLLKKHGVYKIDFQSGGFPSYRCHVCPIDYNPFLTLYYNNNQRFLQKHLDASVIKNTKIFEKTEIGWFSFEDLKRKKHLFRKFYRNIVQLILNDRKNIENFVRGKQLDKNKKNIGNKTRKFRGGCGNNTCFVNH